MRLRKRGTTAAISIGDFERGSAAPLHHHEREQGDIGVSGTLDVVIGTGGRVEKLAPGAGRAATAEFSPVRMR